MTTRRRPLVVLTLLCFVVPACQGGGVARFAGPHGDIRPGDGGRADAGGVGMDGAIEGDLDGDGDVDTDEPIGGPAPLEPDPEIPPDVTPVPDVPEAEVERDFDPPPVTARCAATSLARGVRRAVNDDPRFVQVLDSNIENLELPTEFCRGDWTDLIYYMRDMRPQPDIFLVQQISNRAQLDVLLRAMNRSLRSHYEGIIADPSPRPMNSPCRAAKDYQTNAIIYRSDRFEPIGERRTWQPYARIDGACSRSGLSRTLYIMHTFRDRVAQRDVTAVSLHWSTNNGGDDSGCTERNAEDLDRAIRLGGYEADLVIVGGDANEPDGTGPDSLRPWYRMMNGDHGTVGLGFRDPIYARCERSDAFGSCLANQWTIGEERRIDFLFARRGECFPATGRAHTVTFDEADTAARRATGGDSSLNYSDHRAVHAEIYY
jgi:hypothetical protein